jgi:hypothetical protein
MSLLQAEQSRRYGVVGLPRLRAQQRAGAQAGGRAPSATMAVSSSLRNWAILASS